MFHGINVRFSSAAVGQQTPKNSQYEVGNHKSCINGGLLAHFNGKKFTEYLIEIDRNNYIYSEDKEEKLFSFGEIMQTIKKELIYVEI